MRVDNDVKFGAKVISAVLSGVLVIFLIPTLVILTIALKYHVLGRDTPTPPGQDKFSTCTAHGGTYKYDQSSGDYSCTNPKPFPNDSPTPSPSETPK